ncbi:hypothetical protein HID58_051264 [Brassica napus]|uniref:BnaC03g12970D protein n=2 Tax=Brassica napus TaxID=3708 RepID=A0A078FF09_BRANA|nr:hypothetical protein HID58_051264 [Brassica napus]CAF1698650.1 unnamed protein product [Brassica napus]CDY11871.1 BnaC03g12970D [Brassica napus]
MLFTGTTVDFTFFSHRQTSSPSKPQHSFYRRVNHLQIGGKEQSVGHNDGLHRIEDFFALVQLRFNIMGHPAAHTHPIYWSKILQVRRQTNLAQFVRIAN